jgi:phosphate-selective porin OprO/OprP
LRSAGSAVALLAAGLLGFGDPAPARADERAENGYEELWSKAELHRGGEGTFLQSFRLSGRLQLDLAQVDSSDADHGELDVRRFRFGFKTVFAEKFTLHVEADFDPQDADPFYKRLTDAYIAWAPRDAFTLTVGKHSAGFTLDGMTSSKRLLTIDRSNLANNIWFTEEYMPGVSVEGAAGRLIYHAGVFSSGDKNREFGNFEGGVFLLVTLGRDFAEAWGAKEALLRLNLVDNEPYPDNGFTRPLERIGSLNFSYEQTRWGLRADVSAATGYLGQSDLWGLYVMPFYRPSDSLELVGRYTLVESEEPNGVRFARYERSIAEGRGDRYDELYLGLNYYLYGHRLKLQNGAQYVEMRDRADDGGAYTGWGWTTALRVSW